MGRSCQRHPQTHNQIRKKNDQPYLLNRPRDPVLNVHPPHRAAGRAHFIHPPPLLPGSHFKSRERFRGEKNFPDHTANALFPLPHPQTAGPTAREVILMWGPGEAAGGRGDDPGHATGDVVSGPSRRLEWCAAGPHPHAQPQTPGRRGRTQQATPKARGPRGWADRPKGGARPPTGPSTRAIRGRASTHGRRGGRGDRRKE